MSEILALLPLALTMNLGPGIITAIIVMTGNKPIKKTLLYLAGSALGVAVMGFAAFLIFDFVSKGGTSSGQSTMSRVLDYVFAGLLAVLGVWVFTQRKKAQKPRWMASIQEASSKRIFTMGLLFYSVFPSDFIVLLTVGYLLAQHKMHFSSVFPFFALTLLIAAMPVLSFLLLRKRAERVMPRVRDWLDSRGWIINEVVIVFFILMTLFG
ncbi:MAG: GAP family protein [Actinomycetia bacterium]|nr:GAP family protein [Actinomycetes bacterium]